MKISNRGDLGVIVALNRIRFRYL